MLKCIGDVVRTRELYEGSTGSVDVTEGIWQGCMRSTISREHQNEEQSLRIHSLNISKRCSQP